MKKQYILFFALICFLNLNAAIGTWTSRASVTVQRATHAGFSIKGKGYVCGGVAAAGSNDDLKDLWEYNPNTNTWTQKADMPGDGRRELSAFAIDTLAYVGHGRNVNSGEIFFSFYKYDPALNSWTAISDCPVKRYTSTGFSIDSIGYITCGIIPGVARYKDLYAYNPRTDKWNQKASLPDSALNRSYACVVSLNHKAYLMGGFEGQHMNDFYEYDPLTDEWIGKASFPGGKRNAVAGFAFGDYVVMGMGRDGSNLTYKDCYYYDPNADKWTRMNDYPEDNSAGGATFSINGQGYLVAGNTKAGTLRDYNYRLTAPELSLKPISEKDATHFYHAFGSDLLYARLDQGMAILQIYDINGRLVQSNKINAEKEELVSFELNGLSRGQYIAVLNQSGKQSSLRLILQ